MTERIDDALQRFAESSQAQAAAKKIYDDMKKAESEALKYANSCDFEAFMYELRDAMDKADELARTADYLWRTGLIAWSEYENIAMGSELYRHEEIPSKMLLIWHESCACKRRPGIEDLSPKDIFKKVGSKWQE